MESPLKEWKPDTKRLYSVATSAGWTREAVHHFIKASFDKDSTKDLTWSEYNATMQVVSESYQEEE